MNAVTLHAMLEILENPRCARDLSSPFMNMQVLFSLPDTHGSDGEARAGLFVQCLRELVKEKIQEESLIGSRKLSAQEIADLQKLRDALKTLKEMV